MASVRDAIRCVDQDDAGVPGAGIGVFERDEARDDHEIATVNIMGRSTVHAHDTGAARSRERIGGHTHAVGDIPHLNSLVVKDASGI